MTDVSIATGSSRVDFAALSEGIKRVAQAFTRDIFDELLCGVWPEGGIG